MRLLLLFPFLQMETAHRGQAAWQGERTRQVARLDYELELSLYTILPPINKSSFLLKELII